MTWLRDNNTQCGAVKGGIPYEAFEKGYSDAEKRKVSNPYEPDCIDYDDYNEGVYAYRNIK